jgi:hypothetical protein
MKVFAKFQSFLQDENNFDDYGMINHSLLSEFMNVSFNCALMMDYISSRNYFDPKMICDLVLLDKLNKLPKIADAKFESGMFLGV